MRTLAISLILVLQALPFAQASYYAAIPEPKLPVQARNTAFMVGEELKYRIHYGFVNAGFAEIKVQNIQEIKGRQAYHINGYGRSASSFDWFFKVRDHFQSWVDTQYLRPLQFSKDQQEGSFRAKDFVTFDYSDNTMNSERWVKRPFPAGIQDVISVAYYARGIDMSNAYPGQVFPLNLYLDDSIYRLQFKYVGKEVLKTDLGKLNTLKLVPMVVAERVFRDAEGLTMWVTDDENKLPLIIKAEVLVGSIKASIQSAKGLRHPLNRAG